MRLTFLRNRGDLAEGWYDPITKRKAIESFAESSSRYEPPNRGARRASPNYGINATDNVKAQDGESEDDIVGPALPPLESRGKLSGPSVPGIQDLELKRGMLPLA
jgi:hypothetical protein